MIIETRQFALDMDTLKEKIKAGIGMLIKVPMGQCIGCISWKLCAQLAIMAIVRIMVNVSRDNKSLNRGS